MFSPSKIIQQRCNRYYRGKHCPIGLKINLYCEKEVVALTHALHMLQESPQFIECIMVGDSYFNTHLGMDLSTLSSESNLSWCFNILEQQVASVARASAQYFSSHEKPFLVADLPCGSISKRKSCLTYATRMITAGADMVKIEVANPYDIEMIEHLTNNKISVMAHIGYTPQKSKLKRYGTNIDEAIQLAQQSQDITKAGATSLVLEMVTQEVNFMLSNHQYNTHMPIYSIFSGQAPSGGQCLNIWDSLIIPEFKNTYFPRTAKYTREYYPDCYTVKNLTDSIQQLIHLTLTCQYPASPKNLLSSSETALITSINPWELAYAAIERNKI